MTDPNFGGNDAIAEVWYWFESYAKAKTVIEQVNTFTHLSNAVGDLTSWHPNWDYEAGIIRGIIEEDE